MSDKPALSTSGQEIPHPRPIDGKFGFVGQKIVNLVSGQEIPEDEPLFLLRARDHYALVAIHAYQGACESGCNELHLAGIQQVREKFCQFQANHPERMKQPGITRHLKLDAHSPAVQALESQPQDLHAVICQAVGLMNQGEMYKAHTVLREALIKYADAPVESLSKSKAEEHLGLKIDVQRS